MDRDDEEKGGAEKSEVPAVRYGIDVQILRPASRIPFKDSYQKWRIKKYQKFVEAGTEFAEALVEHQSARRRLKDLDAILDAEAAERELRLKEAQERLREADRKEKRAKIDDEISMMEAQGEKERLEKKRGGRDEEEEARKRIEREKRKLKTEAEVERLRLEETFAKRKGLRVFREEKRAEVLSDSTLSEDEKEKELEDVEEFIQSCMERL